MLKGVTRKVIVAIVMLMGISVAAQIGYNRLVYRPYHQLIIDSLVVSSFNRLKEAIGLTNQFVDTMAFEYAAWNQLYKVVKDDNLAIIDFYLDINASMVENSIDGIVMLDNNKQVIASLQNMETIGYGQKVNESLLPLFRSEAVFISPDEVVTNQNQYISNLIYVDSNEGPVVVIAASIVKSDGYGPSVGTFIIWRKLDQRWLNELKAVIGHDLQMHPHSDADHLDQDMHDIYSNQQLYQGVLYNEYMTLSFENSVTKQPLMHLVQPAPAIVTEQEPPYLKWSVATLLLCMILILLLMQRHLLNPLMRLVNHLESDAGDGGMVSRSLLDESHFHDQWRQIAKAYNKQTQRIHQSQETLMRLNERLTDMSYQDPLIGIANRRRLDEYLEVTWEACLENKQWFTVILADVDLFKKYNDNYGHLAGDQVLRRVGQALAGQIYPDRDLVARYGGEEFALVVSNTSPEAVGSILKRLCKTIHRLQIEHKYSPEHKVVTISLGACCVHLTGELTLENVIEFADQALYQAKQQGRNGWSINQISGNDAH